KFLFSNKKILDVFGMMQNELMGKYFQELIKEKYKNQFIHNLELLRKKEKVDRFRVELINKKKENIWLDLNLVTVRESGKIIGFEGIARDVTESLIMEHQKKELEQLNLNILKSISSPHFVIDRRYSIIYHNEYAKKLMKTDDNLIDKNIFSVVPPEFQKKLKEPFISLFKGETNNIKLRIGTGKEKGKDFEKMFEVSGYPYTAPTNYIRGIFVLIENITYQYKSEKNFAQADKLATIGKLASGVAHEIRNPLNIIRGVVQYIQETQQSDDSISGFLNILKDEVNRVTLFLEDFLSLTKQKELQLTKLDINVLIDSVLKFFIHELNSRKINLTKKFSKKPLFVLVDENQLRQVILNVLKNSTEAIGGRRKREIFIKTGFLDNSREAVFVEIEDTGGGITKKVASNIFEPFFSTKKAGSGLGLAICAEILKNHHGSITFESTVKKGSKMKILLPSSNYIMNNHLEDLK
ncbi:PAS domain S-box protein, partial [bacterium]|nr:PAS domain S-box protein [bacterium]